MLDFTGKTITVTGATKGIAPDRDAHEIHLRLLNDYREATAVLAPILRRLSAPPATTAASARRAV